MGTANLTWPQVAVHTPADPVLAAWQGGALLGASPEYARRAVTRAEYEEQGTYCRAT